MRRTGNFMVVLSLLLLALPAAAQESEGLVGPDKGSIELKLFNRIKQGDSLQAIAAWVGALLFNSPTFIDGFLDGSHDKPGFQLFHQPISEFDSFLKIVPGVNM